MRRSTNNTSSPGKCVKLGRGLTRILVSPRRVKPRRILVYIRLLLGISSCLLFLTFIVLIYTSSRSYGESFLKKYDLFGHFVKLSMLRDRFVTDNDLENHWRLKYLYDPTWSRFDVQWFKREALQAPTVEESSYRLLYSPVKRALSDGIGHGVSVWNIEMVAALRLHLTYTHRKSTYSTITRDDPYAVEKFFGWGQEEISRSKVKESECTTEVGQCEVCSGVNVTSKSRPFGIERVVEIPKSIAERCRVSQPGSECDERIRDFVAKHNESHTIFQMPVGSCRSPPTSTYFLLTRSILANKYWRQHSREYHHDSTYSPRSPTRHLRFNDKELVIAVHVRRGDFLSIKHRLTIDDRVYARIIKRALNIIQGFNNTFASIPVSISIYSEGRLLKNLPKSVHNVEEMDSMYVDSHGIVRDAEWWENLILHPHALIDNISSLPDVNIKNPLRVTLRIAEPILSNLHEMASADLFIGSSSGLSTNIIWSLARGVTFVPRERELDKGGCCAMVFDPLVGKFDEDLFKSFWTLYAEANLPSIQYALYRRVLSKQKELGRRFQDLRHLEFPAY